MKNNISALLLLSLNLFILPLGAQSEEESSSEIQSEANDAEEALVGKFAEEISRLEHGAAKAFKGEARRDQELVYKKNHPTQDLNEVKKSIDSIEADLQERERIANEIESN